MTKPSLHAQAAAIDVAVRYAGRSGESDMLVRGLKAARQTLFKLQSWRDRLPTEAISVPASRLQRGRSAEPPKKFPSRLSAVL